MITENPVEIIQWCGQQEESCCEQSNIDIATNPVHQAVVKANEYLTNTLNLNVIHEDEREFMDDSYFFTKIWLLPDLPLDACEEHVRHKANEDYEAFKDNLYKVIEETLPVWPGTMYTKDHPRGHLNREIEHFIFITNRMTINLQISDETVSIIQTDNGRW